MNLLDRFLRRLVQAGELSVAWPNGRFSHYSGPRPHTRRGAIRIVDNATVIRLAVRPMLAAGEAYMDGRLIVEDGDILQFLDLIAFNTRWERGHDTRDLIAVRGRLFGWLRQLNSRNHARRNVAHHYDLSDRLYDLFLDADRQYSCAYFSDRSTDLETAQQDKMAHIAAKLLLEKGQRVLDIGCGWGGFALYLNRIADVDVLGITLSAEQLAVARHRAKQAGVALRVRFEMLDYREITGSFDRIVSVGMFEHVGRPNYERFFDVVTEAMAPNGVGLVHCIGRAGGPGATDPWTRKYIFPGGYSPALSEVMPAIEHSQLWATDIEILRLHYAYTLEHWYKRVLEARDEIVRLYDERFLRMWLYYLAGAIVGFRYGGHCNLQIQIARQREAVPLTRDYIAPAEARYRERIPRNYMAAAE